MPFNILLLPLIGGFFFIHRWNRTKFQAIRLDKERLLFHASLAGGFLLFLAFILEALIPPFIPCVKWFPCLPTLPFQYMGVSSLALALGLALPLILNLFWPLYNESKRVIEEEGDPFEQLINGALDAAKPVMLTLKGGKVYVGFVVSSFVPAREQRTIHIAPLRSGYRGEKKQRVCFTTEYAEALDKIPQDVARLKEDKRQSEERLQQLKEKEALSEKERAALVSKREDAAKTAAGVVNGILAMQKLHEEDVIRALTEEIEELETALNDFGIIILIDEIVSSTLYNARIHAEYFTHNEAEE
jgi:F0F1-type ATP synthase epsilon subunit